MGVSLQAYRIRIGTFLSTSFKLPKMKTQPSNISNVHLGKILTLALLLSGLASVYHVLHQVNHVPGHVTTQSAGDGAVHHAYDTPSYHLDRPCRLTSRDRNFLAKMGGGKGCWN